MLLCE